MKKTRLTRLIFIASTAFLLLKTLNLFLSDLSFQKGYVENLKGNYESALEKINAALSLNRHEPDYYVELADAACELRQTEDCLRAASKAISLNPQNSLTLKMLFKTFARAGLYENALLMAEKLTVLSPTDPEGYYFKALALRGLGKTAEALDVVIQGLDLKGDYTEALNLKLELELELELGT
jgi:Flp pilus assembly protein TadD